MGFYSRFILPTVISCGCGMRPITELRRAVVPRAEGVVLELGLGSGLNLPLYDAGKVSKVYGLEPEAAMRAKARRRADQSPIPVAVLAESAEAVSLADRSVDTVVVTFTLCTIPDVAGALREAHRVLRPEGRLLFCEHGRSPDPVLFQRQARIEPTWKRLFGGCHLTRDIPALVEAAGFAVDQLHADYMGPRPSLGGYIYRGSATPCGSRVTGGAPAARAAAT
ncbi:class I SAM-dependent methyltransferase [Phenylobacterium sp. LjRoot219]|uniref:class I SAM-dependent methyltransferase n=1 Tax=Phenylobacterium sp. LjRoot219 TaxID=3342283 RepID=UPI003ECD543E